MRKIDLRMIRQLRGTRGRIAAVTLIIACGVGVHVGMGTSVATILHTRDTVVARDRLADYQVLFAPTDESRVPDLTAVPGVTGVDFRMIAPGTIELADGHRVLQAVGHFLPAAGDAQLDRIEVVEGRRPGDGEVLIDRALATYHGYHVGDPIEVALGGPARSYQVSGIAISPEYLVATANPEFMIPQKGSLGVVYLPDSQRQAVLGARVVDSALLSLDDGVDRGSFDEVLAPHFAGLQVSRWEARDDNFSYAFLRKDTNAIAMFVPAIVAVFLLVTLLVALVIFGQLIRSQRQEIGTMMALGVAKSRIIRSFLLAGLLIGVVAGVLGLGLSFGISYAFDHDYAKALGLSIVLPRIQPLIMLQGIGLAIAAALVAVGLPTLHIVGLKPIDAVRPPMDVVVRRRAGWLARRLARSPLARYGFRNITRNRRRFVSAVLSIAAAIAVAMAYRTSTSSIDATFADYFETDHWDLVVDYAGSQAGGGAGLGAIDGVDRVEEYAKGVVKVVGRSGYKVLPVLAMRYPSALKSHDIARGHPLGAEPGGVIIYQKLADDLGVAVGDSLDVRGPAGRRRLLVAGITTFSPEQIYTQLEDGQALLGLDHRVTGALVAARPGRIDAAAAAIRARPEVGEVHSRQQIVSALKVHSKELMVVISIAIALALLVAVLVIATTVTINVLERESDYATLRVLGFTFARVRRGILLEVLVTGALGATIAVPLSYAISRFLDSQMGKAFFPVRTVLEPWSLAIVVAAAIAFMPVAALPGLARVKRVDLAAAVRRKAMG